MSRLDEFISQLKEASKEEDFNAIEAIYREHADELPYSKQMVEAIADKDPALGLACLIRLYTADVRDSTPKSDTEHLIQTIILLNWADGLQYLLQAKPELINIPAMMDTSLPDSSTSRLELDCTLLEFAIDNKCAPHIIQILMDAKPNLALTSNAGYNIVHEIATDKRAKKFKDVYILDWILNDASLEALNAESDSGATPYQLATLYGNQTFINTFTSVIRSRFGDEIMDNILSETLDRVSINWAAPEFFTRSIEDKKRYLKDNFSPRLPKYDPVMLITSLIGKDLARQSKSGIPMNARIFANQAFLCDYLIKMCNKESGNSIVNAILFVPEGESLGAHSVNIFCIKSDSGIHAILIDGSGDTSKYCTTLEADLKNSLAEAKISFESVHSKTRIQYNRMAGCQIIAAYLAGKLSRLSPKDGEQLYSTLKAKSENGAVHLGNFPLWLGMLGIAQSMETIEHEKARIPQDELEQSRNHRGESFNQRLERGKAQKFCPGYTSLENKTINTTLEQKKNHQSKHALAAAELTNEELLEKMATILGLKLTSPDWKKEILTIIPEIEKWRNLAERQPKPSNLK